MLGVGEGDAVEVVGVASDAESALVVELVVAWAEADEVRGVGGAAIAPVDDVVDLDVAVGGAARHPAAAVAAFDDAAGAIGDDALGATDRERHAVALPHRLHDHVTQQVIDDRGGELPAVGGGDRAVGDVEVDPGAVVLAA